MGRPSAGTGGPAPTVGLLVVAGGGARRLGGRDKVMLPLADGRPVLAHVLDVAAARRVVAGPPRPVAGVDVWAAEDPPGGGPVAGIAAALPHLRTDVVVVVAGDLPHAAAAVPALLAALPGHDLARVVSGGRPQHLLAAWHRSALAAALADLGDPAGAAVRALAAGRAVAEVADPAQWGHDLDTPDDVRRLLGPAAGLDGGGG